MTALGDFAFSTSWNWRGSDSGERVIGEILELGFNKVELNYRVTRTMLKTIVPFVERGKVEITSVHDVFPAFDDARFDTDSRYLGYSDIALRSIAVGRAIGSAEAGARLGAKAVVIHAGAMPTDEIAPSRCGLVGVSLDEELKRRWREYGPDSTPYRSLFEEFVEYRERNMGNELERILDSLERVAERIVRGRLDIRIGIENRPMAFQIPDFKEMRWLLDRLGGAPVGLWLDTGHGAVLRNMGFFDDIAEATSLSGRLVGAHIHDADGVDDHFAPYSKEGLDPYLGLLRAAPIRVLELGPKNAKEDIVAGAKRLSEALGSQ